MLGSVAPAQIVPECNPEFMKTLIQRARWSEEQIVRPLDKSPLEPGAPLLCAAHWQETHTHTPQSCAKGHSYSRGKQTCFAGPLPFSWSAASAALQPITWLSHQQTPPMDLWLAMWGIAAWWSFCMSIAGQRWPRPVGSFHLACSKGFSKYRHVTFSITHVTFSNSAFSLFVF